MAYVLSKLRTLLSPREKRHRSPLSADSAIRDSASSPTIMEEMVKPPSALDPRETPSGTKSGDGGDRKTTSASPTRDTNKGDTGPARKSPKTSSGASEDGHDTSRYTTRLRSGKLRTRSPPSLGDAKVVQDADALKVNGNSTASDQSGSREGREEANEAGNRGRSRDGKASGEASKDEKGTEPPAGTKRSGSAIRDVGTEAASAQLSPKRRRLRTAAASQRPGGTRTSDTPEEDASNADASNADHARNEGRRMTRQMRRSRRNPGTSHVDGANSATGKDNVEGKRAQSAAACSPSAVRREPGDANTVQEGSNAVNGDTSLSPQKLGTLQAGTTQSPAKSAGLADVHSTPEQGSARQRRKRDATSAPASGTADSSPELESGDERSRKKNPERAQDLSDAEDAQAEAGDSTPSEQSKRRRLLLAVGSTLSGIAEPQSSAQKTRRRLSVVSTPSSSSDEGAQEGTADHCEGASTGDVNDLVLPSADLRFPWGDAPPEQISTIFTEPDTRQRRGASKRPMHFYLGLTRSNKIELAEKIIVNGGRISKTQGGENDDPAIYPLLDADSRPVVGGRTAYAETYVDACLREERTLDISDFRLGQRRQRASGGGETDNPGQSKGAREIDEDDRLALQVIAAAERGARRGSPSPSRKQRVHSQEQKNAEDEILFDFACANIADYGGYSSRQMWNEAARQNVLGRVVSGAYLRGRYCRFDPSGTKLTRYLDDQKRNGGRATQSRRRSSAEKVTETRERSTAPGSGKDDDGSADDEDEDSENDEISDIEADKRAKRVFEAWESRNGKQHGVSQSLTSSRDNPDSSGTGVRASGRVRSSKRSNHRRPHRGMSKTRRPKGSDLKARVRAVVRELSVIYSVSERRAFRALKASDGIVDDAHSQLQKWRLSRAL